MHPVLKGLTELVVSIGVGAVVENAIKATIPVDTAVFRKLTIGVGSVVLSGLVASRAADFAVTQITETTQEIKEALAVRRKTV